MRSVVNFSKVMINISAICDWAGTNPNQRNFVEGERILKAGHIIKCGKLSVSSSVDAGSLNVKAYCLQTSQLRQNPHVIDGTLSNSGDIKKMICSCKAGLGEKCKHILATLLYCSRYEIEDLTDLSCTDTACEWKKSFKEALGAYVPQPLLQHACFKRTGNKFEYDASKDKEVEEIILANLPVSAFTKQELGRHHPVTASETRDTRAIDREAVEKLFANQNNRIMEIIHNLQVPVTRECCLESLKKVDGKRVDICEKTMTSYRDWQSERQYRITGTNCYNLFTYTKNKKPDWKKKCEALFDSKDFKSKYTEYGKEKEREARDVFVAVSGCPVLQTGLIISEISPWLAFSPDGIIWKDDEPYMLLERKCPFKGKEMNIAEAIKHEFGTCLHFGEDISLKKKHKYYGQVQLGMAILNFEKAVFFVYALFDKSFITIEVNFDEEFVTEMISTLKFLYYNIILHEICLRSDNNKENTDTNNNDAVLK